MSELDVPPLGIIAASSTARTVPKGVRVAVWLWAPLIVAQSAFLAFLVVTMAIAATKGPAAIIIIFFLPVSLFIAALVISEVLLLVRLRRGSRIARGWLLGLAIFSAVIAVWQILATMTAPTGTFGPLPEWLVIGMTAITTIVGALSLVSAVLPFRAPAKGFFAPRPAGP